MEHAGEITSRLSADTTTVSDQICLNLNVSLRSITQAAIVLVFMFQASWRLSIITFIIIPAIILITKLYGAYYRCACFRPCLRLVSVVCIIYIYAYSACVLTASFILWVYSNSQSAATLELRGT